MSQIGTQQIAASPGFRTFELIAWDNRWSLNQTIRKLRHESLADVNKHLG
jgi:hypothetical protein